MQTPKLYLVVVAGEERGLTFVLGEGPVIIGRSGLCDIRLHDTSISSQHMQIDNSASPTGGLTFRDLNSRNGVLVNGLRMSQGELKPGDLIRLGTTVLIVDVDRTGPVSTGAIATHPVERQVIIDREESTARQIASLNIDDVDFIDHVKDEFDEATAQQKLALLLDMPAILTGPGPQEQKMNKILTRLLTVIEADNGCILLHNDQTHEFDIVAAISKTSNVSPDQPLVISGTIIRKAIEERKGILATNVRNDEQFKNAASIHAFEIDAMIAAPCISHDVCWGVIFISTRQGGKLYSPRDLSLTTGLANQMAIAIENHEILSRQIRHEALAEIGEFVAGVSHHIKNMLFGLSTAKTLLTSAVNSRQIEDIQKLWPILDSNLDEVGDLINDLIYFSKRRSTKKMLLSLNEIIGSSLSFYQHYLNERQIDVRTQLDRSLPLVTADAQLLQRVIINLLNNSADALEEETVKDITIMTGLTADQHHAFLTIGDTGHGIEAKYMPQLFSFMFSTKGEKGTGIGLYISREIIRDLDGDITAESEPGKGTRFRITLPIERDTIVLK